MNNKINLPMEIKLGDVTKKLNLEISINITEEENNTKPELIKTDIKNDLMKYYKDEDTDDKEISNNIKNLKCNKDLSDIEVINSEDMMILCVPFTDIESLNCRLTGHLFDMVIVKMDNKMFVTRYEILACDKLYKTICQESNNAIPVILVEMDRETKKIQKVNYSCR